MKSEERHYPGTRFPAEVLKEAVAVFDEQVNPGGKGRPHLGMNVVLDDADKGHDDEQEFFADYRKSSDDIHYHRWYDAGASWPSAHIPTVHLLAPDQELTSTLKPSVGLKYLL
jgi:hypothetical protein